MPAARPVAATKRALGGLLFSHRMKAASQFSGQSVPVMRARVSFQLSGCRTESYISPISALSTSHSAGALWSVGKAGR